MKSTVIAGSGGQGVLFLGKLLAQSAMLSGKNVTWFPSYGAEMRGGTANCTVVISDEPIGSPIVRNPDILVVLNEASRERFEGRLREGGLMIVDASVVRTGPSRRDIKVLGVPSTEMAGSLGSPKAANMVLLGALLEVEGLADRRIARRALTELTPPRRAKSMEVNMASIIEGMKYREDTKGQDPGR